MCCYFVLVDWVSGLWFKNREKIPLLSDVVSMQWCKGIQMKCMDWTSLSNAISWWWIMKWCVVLKKRCVIKKLLLERVLIFWFRIDLNLFSCFCCVCIVYCNVCCDLLFFILVCLSVYLLFFYSLCIVVYIWRIFSICNVKRRISVWITNANNDIHVLKGS